MPEPESTATQTRPVEWEDVANCNFCGASERRLYLHSPVPRWYEARNLVLQECAQCRLVYASPRPEARSLNQGFMAGDEAAQAATKRKLERANAMDAHRKVVKTAASRFEGTPRNLFDVGCGAGTVLVAAREHGIAAAGNDLNGHAVASLREMGFDAHCAFTQDLRLTQRYDLVTCLDYIEHTYTPFDDLKFLYSITADGGVLYLKTLYLNCPRHLELGAAWGLLGAGHFHYFWPDVLEKMVAAAGFHVLEVETRQLIRILARRVDSLPVGTTTGTGAAAIAALAAEAMRAEAGRARAQVLLAAAKVDLDAGNAQAAEASLREALAARADDGQLHGYMGLALAAQNRAEEAIAALERALRHPPLIPRWPVELARLLIHVGNLERAAVVLDEADRAWPGHRGLQQMRRQLVRG